MRPISQQSTLSSLEPNCKFAVLAVHNVRADVPQIITLQDGTKALTAIPFPLDDHWRLWLGAMQSSNLEACNLFLVRTAVSGWSKGELPVFGGDLDAKLMGDVGGIFAFLRIVGGIEYTNAFCSRATSRTECFIVGISRRPNVSTLQVGACHGWFAKQTCVVQFNCIDLTLPSSGDFRGGGDWAADATR